MESYTNSTTPIKAHDLAMVAFNSNPLVRARNAVYNIDSTMQTNYDSLKAQLILQLSPVLVVQSDGSGGIFTLVYQGRSETVSPVSPIFQLMKSVSHTPLGIYVIIAPYLAQPEAAEWVKPLMEFHTVLEAALANLPGAGLPEKALISCTKVIKGGLDFIDRAVATKTFTIDQFENFTSQVASAIATNMNFAAEAQIAGVEALLKRWREELGPKQWKNLYSIILAIWTTEVKNQNWLIVKQMMDQDKVDSQLITISIASFAENTVAAALDNLARIVQDNVAAAMIFPTNAVIADALKGPEDLLAGSIEKILSCPHARKSM